MSRPIEQLLALQEVDSAIRELTERITATPAAIAAVEARRKELEDGLLSRRQRLEEGRKVRRHLEGEVDSIRAKLSKYQGQLMEVKTNDAYRAMLHEIEGTRQEIAAREEKILEHMLLADDLERELKAGEQELQGARPRLERERADLERQGREAEERRTELAARREQIAAAIDARVRATYEKVARLRHGMAVAGARDELCLGCRVKLRPQVFQEVRNGSDLHQCDSCSRFLFYVESAPPPPPAGAPADDPPPADPPGARDQPPAEH